MERPDLDALEREMADIRRRVAELEKGLRPDWGRTVQVMPMQGMEPPLPVSLDALGGMPKRDDDGA